MHGVIIVTSLLTGWYIRRKSAEILAIRKANKQVRADRQKLRARREDAWNQIKAIW